MKKSQYRLLGRSYYYYLLLLSIFITIYFFRLLRSLDEVPDFLLTMVPLRNFCLLFFSFFHLTLPISPL